MRLFVCDSQCYRNWGLLLTETFAKANYTYEEDQERFCFCSESRRVSDAVVIYHPEPAQEEIKGLQECAEKDGLWVICVSGGGCGSHYSSTQRVYGRRASLGTDDPGFRQCFVSFWENLKSTETADFSLLEPDAWPEHLVAAALLLGGLRHGNASGAIRSEWAKIEEAWRMSFLDSVAKEFAEHKGGGDLWESVGLKKEEAGLCLAQIDKTECLDQAFDVIRSALPQRPSTTY